jgi:undecaprenyl pyrophosphate phosphatase UppP
MEWQYDLDLAWWVVVGWTAPVIFIGSWFLEVLSKPIVTGAYCAIVILFTAYAIWLANALRKQKVND